MRHRRQIARVLGEERELFLLLVGLALFEDRDRLFADAVDVEALGGEDARGGRRLDAQDADQQMLGADVLVEHRLRFVRGVREDLFRLLGKRQFGRRGDAVDEEPVAFHLAADLLRLDVEAGEDLLDDLLPLAEDAEEDVLGLDDAGAELRCFVSGEEECAAGFLVVFFEHGLGRSCNPAACFISNTRSQRAARSGLCVTITDVSPRFSWHSRIRSNTRSLVSRSRLPVGSSARKSSGSASSARAMATRCCSPPES